MLTKEKRRTTAHPDEPADIEEVEYPQEVIDRLNKEFEIAKAQIAMGILKPVSLKEVAARYGIELDDDDE